MAGNNQRKRSGGNVITAGAARLFVIRFWAGVLLAGLASILPGCVKSCGLSQNEKSPGKGPLEKRIEREVSDFFARFERLHNSQGNVHEKKADRKKETIPAKSPEDSTQQ